MCCDSLVVQNKIEKNISNIKTCFTTQCSQPPFFGSPMRGLDFTFFIYLNTSLSGIGEYACNICETNFSDKILYVLVWEEQPKHKIAEVDFMSVLIFGIPCMIIVFLFLQPSSDVHIHFSHIS